MKITKVPSKASLIPLNLSHVGKSKERTREFEILLSTTKNKTVPFEVAPSKDGEIKKQLETEENVSKFNLKEAKSPPSSTPPVVGKEEKDSSVEDRKILARLQRIRERRLKDENCLAPHVFSNSVQVEQNVPHRPVLKLDGVPKLNVLKYSESTTKTRTAENVILHNSNYPSENRVVQHSREDTRPSDGGIVETEKVKGKVNEKARVTASEKVALSAEELVPLESPAIEAEEMPYKKDSSAFSPRNTTTIVFDTGGAEGLPEMRKEPVVRAQPSIVSEGGEETFFRASPRSGKVSENSGSESDHIFRTKDGNVYTLRGEVRDLTREIVRTQVSIEQPSFQEKTTLVHEGMLFQNQDDATKVSGEKNEAEVPPSRPRGPEDKTIENVTADIGNKESISKGEIPLRTPSESRHQTTGEGSVEHRRLEAPPVPTERTLYHVGDSENFQEVRSDTREAEVVIFYEKREKLESFKETLEENLSELVQRSKAQEAYILQGSTRNEETVPVHSVPRIVERMFIQREERAVMTLNPPELGRVEVVIEKSGEEVHVTLRVYTEEAKNALEKEVPQLVDRLSERGFDVRVQIEKHEEGDLFQEEDRRERRQRERRPNKVEREDFSETMREVIG